MNGREIGRDPQSENKALDPALSLSVASQHCHLDPALHTDTAQIGKMREALEG